MMTNQILEHYGRKGMKWGVITPEGPSVQTTGQPTPAAKTSKPASSISKDPSTPGGAAQAHRAAVSQDAAYLRSIGMGDLADEVEKAFASSNLSSIADEDEKKEEKKSSGKAGGAGKAAAGAAASDKLKKDKKAEAEKKAKEEAKKKEKEEAERLKAERSKWESLAKNQREIASSFRDAANQATSEIGKLDTFTKNVSRRLESIAKDLKAAEKQGNFGQIQTIKAMMDRVKGQMEAAKAAMAAQTEVSKSLIAKSEEWEAKATETLTKIEGEDDKVKHELGQSEVDDIIAHFGIKGMRWGVRRTAEQLSKSNPRAAQRKASAEAKTLSDKELKDRVQRMNLEKQYADLAKQQIERDRTAMQEGSQIVGQVLLNSGKVVLGNVSTKLMTMAVAKSLKKVSRGTIST